MADEEYESLPTSKISAQLLAGAAAGIAEHSVMYPVDVVKVFFLLLIFILENSILIQEKCLDVNWGRLEALSRGHLSYCLHDMLSTASPRGVFFFK